MAAHLSDVEAWRDSLKRRPTIALRRVWGPVSERAAALAGSARRAESVCIAPRLDPFMLAAALECIPNVVLPMSTDTADGRRRHRRSRSVFANVGAFAAEPVARLVLDAGSNAEQ